MGETTKHLPEPWVVKAGSGEMAYLWGGSKGSDLVCSVAGPSNGHDQDAANARRIAACVNACVGIEDPESTVPKMLATLVSVLEDSFQFVRDDQRDDPNSWWAQTRAEIEAAICDATGERER